MGSPVLASLPARGSLNEALGGARLSGPHRLEKQDLAPVSSLAEGADEEGDAGRPGDERDEVDEENGSKSGQHGVGSSRLRCAQCAGRSLLGPVGRRGAAANERKRVRERVKRKTPTVREEGGRQRSTSVDV